MSLISPYKQRSDTPAIDPIKKSEDKSSLSSSHSSSKKDTITTSSPGKAAPKGFVAWIKNLFSKIWACLCCWKKQKPSHQETEKKPKEKVQKEEKKPTQSEQNEQTTDTETTSFESFVEYFPEESQEKPSSKAPDISKPQDAETPTTSSPERPQLSKALNELLNQECSLEPFSPPKKPVAKEPADKKASTLFAQDNKDHSKPAQPKKPDEKANTSSANKVEPLLFYRTETPPMATFTLDPNAFQAAPVAHYLASASFLAPQAVDTSVPKDKPAESQEAVSVVQNKQVDTKRFEQPLVSSQPVDADKEKEIASFISGKKDVYLPFIAYQKQLLRELQKTQKSAPCDAGNFLHALRFAVKNDREHHKITFGTSVESLMTKKDAFGADTPSKEPFTIVDAIAKSTKILLSIVESHAARLDELRKGKDARLEEANRAFAALLQTELASLKQLISKANETTLDGLQNRNLAQTIRMIDEALQTLAKRQEVAAPAPTPLETFKVETKKTDAAIANAKGYLTELTILLANLKSGSLANKKDLLDQAKTPQRQSYVQSFAPEQFLLQDEISKTLDQLFALIDQHFQRIDGMLQTANEKDRATYKKLKAHYCKVHSQELAHQANLLRQQKPDAGSAMAQIAEKLERQAEILRKTQEEKAN